LTLIISVLTPQWAIQVSDRRLVRIREGAAVRADDERNKAVTWCGRLAFAYAGLAELGREKQTDIWLANRLSESEAALEQGSDQGDLLGAVAQRATRYFEGPRISRFSAEMRRHAFVGVGWARFDGEDDVSPYLALVSNFHDPEDGTELAEARPAFGLSMRRLEPGQGGHVMPVGYPLPQSEIDELSGRLAGADADDIALVAVLADKVREAAAASELVGRGLLVNVIPRGGHGDEQAERTTFLRVFPEDELPGTPYRPIDVCGGGITRG
jgi:hypothetical protein